MASCHEGDGATLQHSVDLLVVSGRACGLGPRSGGRGSVRRHRWSGAGWLLRRPRRNTTTQCEPPCRVWPCLRPRPPLGGSGPSPPTQVEWRGALAVKATAQHYSTVWISLSCLAAPAASAPALGVGAQSAGTGGAEVSTCCEGRGATLQHSDQAPLTHSAGGAEMGGCQAASGATLGLIMVSVTTCRFRPTRCCPSHRWWSRGGHLL